MYNQANRGYIHNVSAPYNPFFFWSLICGALRRDLTVKVRKHSCLWLLINLIATALRRICFVRCKTDVRVTVSRLAQPFAIADTSLFRLHLCCFPYQDVASISRFQNKRGTLIPDPPVSCLRRGGKAEGVSVCVVGCVCKLMWEELIIEKTQQKKKTGEWAWAKANRWSSEGGCTAHTGQYFAGVYWSNKQPIPRNSRKFPYYSPEYKLRNWYKAMIKRC